MCYVHKGLDESYDSLYRFHYLFISYLFVSLLREVNSFHL